MMIRDIARARLRSNRPVMFDTNIWLSIYPATSNSTEERYSQDYTAFLGKLIKWNIPIVSTLVVLGEYVNRFARIEYEVYSQAYKDVSYKDYRSSDDFKHAAREISSSVKDILKTPGMDFKWIEAGTVDIHALVDDFSQGLLDFNDSYLGRVCAKNDWPLVTNDRDFRAGVDGLEIWTASPILLAKSQ